MIINNNELTCYKQTEIDSHSKLQFFLEKHSTKEGTWGKLLLLEGEIDFVFLDGQGQELSRTRMNQKHPQLCIPPASWHKIIPVSASFKATLEFFCLPHRYFNKKHGLSAVHGDLVYIYQTYLQRSPPLNILDVGCGSGRNLLYLANMGHTLTGIDHNQSSLNALQEIAQKENLPNIEVLLHDLNQPLHLEETLYDLVLSTVTLQFLNPECIPQLLTKLQTLTKKNGYHCLVFPIHTEAYSLPNFFTYLPQKEEIYHFYQDSGWSILEYKESIGHLHKQDELGRQISGMFGLLLAQKNS